MQEACQTESGQKTGEALVGKLHREGRMPVKWASPTFHAQESTSVYDYLIKPRRSALATAWVRFTASSFLVARFR